MLPDIINYVADPRNGRPIANGQVYFYVDGYVAPTNINDFDVSYLADITADGVVLTQPVYTTQGGVLRTGSLASLPRIRASIDVKRAAVYDECGKLVFSTAYYSAGYLVDAEVYALDILNNLNITYSAEAQAVIDSLGFVRLNPLTFETGATITSEKQLLEWAVADGGNGFHYYWSGALPKTVAAASTPATSGGTGAGAWLIQDDLEQRLAATDSDVLIGGLEARIVAAKARANIVIEPSGGDDTPTLVATALALSASGGGVIELASGQYNINMLFGNGFKIPSNVYVVGKGDSTILKGIEIPPETNFVYVMSFQAATNCGIYKCKIDANKPIGDTAELQWHGVRLDGDCENVYIDDCLLVNGKGDGIWCVINPGFTNPPKNCFITRNRFDGWNRQDIAIVEGDGIQMHYNVGTGVLDVESDSAIGKVNQNHHLSNNKFDIIRVSPLTGLNGDKTNIQANNNKCRILSTWGNNGDILTDNIVTENIEISQCGDLTIRGGSCDRVTQNVTNSTSVQYLNIDGLEVKSSTAARGIHLKDVVSADIKARIRLTAVGSVGIYQANNSTQAAGKININCDIESDSHCVDIVALGLANTTHTVYRSKLKSVNGRSVSKTGATTTGKIEVFDNDLYDQPVIRNSSDVKLRDNRYYDVASINIDQNAGAANISMSCERFYGTIPTITLGPQTITGSVILDDLMGIDVTIGASKLVFTALVATDVFLNDIVSSSATPFTGLAATIRAGSNTKITGDATRYGQWYNGTVWADLS